MSMTAPLSPGRCTWPMSLPTCTFRPVSSIISRTTASASVSPGSILPPGMDQSPAPGSCPRLIISRRPWPSATMAPTQGITEPDTPTSIPFAPKSDKQWYGTEHGNGRHNRHRGQIDVNVAIWSRRIICLIHVNQAPRCRVFLSGKGTGSPESGRDGAPALPDSFRVRPGLPLTGQHYRSGRPFPP